MVLHSFRHGLTMADVDQPQTVRFGLFEVDLSAGELRKNGAKIKLQEQPFRIFSTLLQHAGNVVTREELRRELWPADSASAPMTTARGLPSRGLDENTLTS